MLISKWVTFGQCCQLRKHLYLLHPPLNTAEQGKLGTSVGRILNIIFGFNLSNTWDGFPVQPVIDGTLSQEGSHEFGFHSYLFLFLYSREKTLGMLRGGHFSISLHIATNHKTSRCCVTQFFVFAIIFLFTFTFYFSIAFTFCFVFLLVWVCCGHISISLHIAVPHRTSRSWVLQQFVLFTSVKYHEVGQ